MAIGIISDSDFESELAKAEPLVPPTITTIPTRGRSNGDNNVPEALRKIIGDTAIEEGNKSAKDLAGRLSISPASVSAYKNGATSTASYNQPNKNLADYINKSKLKIARSAAGKLKLALNEITPDKFEGASLKTISGVAKDLAGVVKDMTPSVNEGEQGENKQPFVIYAPSFKQENYFDSIQVEE